MHLGMIITRAGGLDGVALEAAKWRTVLQSMGHSCSILSGEFEDDFSDETLLPEMALDHPLTEWAQDIAFFGESIEDEAAFIEELDAQAEELSLHIESWIREEKIDQLLIENALALPRHLQLGMALEKTLSRTKIPAVAHHHGFAWDNPERFSTPLKGVQQIIDRCFPLNLPNLRHVVINHASCNALWQRGIPAIVMPNVMDFDQPFGQPDDYNATLRSELGLKEDDLVLFQISRIVRRKSIETAIELVHKLKAPRVKLVIAGTSRSAHQDVYMAELCGLVGQWELGDRVLFAGDRFAPTRGATAEGRKIYALSDAYAQATACTYFSRYEGFGNVFLECILAKRPIFVNAYEPVYWPDIGSKGFDAIMIRDNRLTDSAVEEMRFVLTHPERQRSMTALNFALGARHFSFETLRHTLATLFGK